MTIHEILQQYWGYYHFRPLQEDIINSALGGHDTLALLPTGGGKSICFQVPALIREGICIVISPLIALMKDQVVNLRKRGIEAVAIFSGMTTREIDITLDNCIYGKVKFLYVSPERLATELFQVRLAKMRVNFIVVDEAHCISQWGYDFRPPYLKIADIRELVPDSPIIALTATATPEVVTDIESNLNFKNSKFFQKSFERKNIAYAVLYENDKLSKLSDILNKIKGCGIVYVRSRRLTKDVANFLNAHQIQADYYHAGLTQKERNSKQDNWIKDRTRIIVCTNAFGMGIDKPDVRIVVHLSPPESIEAYFQEAGRAGRDEKKAYAVLLYNTNDTLKLKQQFVQAYPEFETIKKVYESICLHLQVAYGSGIGCSFDFTLSDLCSSYNLDILSANSAIRLLEQSNYISLTESVYLPSRLLFVASKEIIYRFEVENKAYEPLIKSVLRNYGGVTNHFSAIHESEVAAELKINVDEVKKMLLHLVRMNLILYEPMKEKPQIIFLQNRIRSEYLHLDFKLIQMQKNKYEGRMKSVISYSENKMKCRSQMLLEYFSEKNVNACGHCDYCLKRHESAIQEKDLLPVKKLLDTTLKDTQFTMSQLTELLPSSRMDVLVKIISWMVHENILSKNGEEYSVLK